MDKNLLKITIVGDVGSGKTWLWQSYFQNRKPTTYIQTIFDNYSTTLSYNGQEIPLSIFELCGDDEYADLRKAVYPTVTNVILLCVAVDNPEFIGKHGKFNNNLDKWSQELKTHCKDVPIVIVGTKNDLRHDQDVVRKLGERKMKPLKYKDVISVTKKFKNSVALDCSAASKDGLQSVFKMAVKLGLRNKAVTGGGK